MLKQVLFLPTDNIKFDLHCNFALDKNNYLPELHEPLPNKHIPISPQGHQSMLKTSSDLNTVHIQIKVFLKKSFSGGSYHRIAMSPCFITATIAVMNILFMEL